MPDPRFEALVALIKPYGSAVVALSGGVDSGLVARAAFEALGPRVLAVTARSPAVPPAEVEEARSLARIIGIQHEVIETREMENPSYRENSPERCYHCKSELYARLAELASRRGFAVLLNGENADDLADFRPGRRAADERAVQAPLAKAHLAKGDVRALARELGLPIWDKPAMPCLASRIPYGDPVDPVWMARIDEAERFIRGLGIRDVRVRHHRDLARVEVAVDAFDQLLAHRDTVVQTLRRLGWTFVSLDLVGFRSGSLNVLVGLKRPARA